jgi:hypothetical protein
LGSGLFLGSWLLLHRLRGLLQLFGFLLWVHWRFWLKGYNGAYLRDHYDYEVALFDVELLDGLAIVVQNFSIRDQLLRGYFKTVSFENGLLQLENLKGLNKK